jgi:hypothetical protein
VTAAEAAATVEGAAAGAAAVKVAGLDKPEFVTRDTFIRQAAERCPKCATKDIFSGIDERQLLLPVNDNYNSRFIASVISYYQDFSEAAETEGARRATGVSAASQSFMYATA